MPLCMQHQADVRCIVSNSVVYAITDTVIDTIVSVAVSDFYTRLSKRSVFGNLQRIRLQSP